MNTAVSPATAPGSSTTANTGISLRHRPAWLLAMGHDSPPPHLRVAGQLFRRIEIFKHDAFAATALYHPEKTTKKNPSETEREPTPTSGGGGGA